MWLLPTSPNILVSLPSHASATQASFQLLKHAILASFSKLSYPFFPPLTETNYLAGSFSSFSSLLKCIFPDNQCSFPTILYHFFLFSFIELNIILYTGKCVLFGIVLPQQDCRAPLRGKNHTTFTHPATHNTK